MQKKLLFFLLLPVLGISQVQIGLDIDGAAPDDQFGYGVAMSADGSVIAVGAPFNDGNGTDAGHVRVFSNASGTWTQIGDDIEGKAAGDQSGFRVALSADGSIVAASSYLGRYVRVYENISGVWTQIGNDIEEQLYRFGHGVALSADGTILAIGVPSAGGLAHVEVYENISGVWGRLGSDISGQNVDNAGFYVAISNDGMTIAIGDPTNWYLSGYNRGSVNVFRYVSGAWTQIGNDIFGAVDNDLAGYRVSL